MITIDGKDYGLNAADLADRRAYINASEAPTICSGDPQKRHLLWLEKTGQSEPEDLSDVLPVQMGSYTEAFNAAWFQKVTGLQVQCRGQVYRNDTLRATIDGLVCYQGNDCVWEAKHIGAFSKVDEAVQRYMPQVFVQMHLTGARQAILSILHGTQNYEWVHVEWDDAYATQVLAQLADFHACVAFGEPPHDAPALEAPTVSEFKPYDLTGNNEWASRAADFLTTEAAAKTHEEAKKAIKALVPDDASEVTGHDIIAKRSKAGAISIKKAA